VERRSPWFAILRTAIWRASSPFVQECRDPSTCQLVLGRDLEVVTR
jgi:hypothetical protein